MATRLYVTPKYEGQFARSFFLSKALGMTISMATLDAYDAFMASKPGFSASWEADEHWYAQLFANPVFDAINNFALYGFGRVPATAASYVERLGMEYYCGSTSDPAQMRELLASVQRHDLLPYIKDVHWS